MSLIFTEKWKDIDLSKNNSYIKRELSGLYEISNLGNVRKKNGGVVKTFKDKDGYLAVNVEGRHGTEYRTKVHQLVADAFLYNPNNKKYNVVNHKDENRMNADVRNLEWCSNKYNIQYSSYKKRKLTDEEIIHIDKWWVCVGSNETVQWFREYKKEVIKIDKTLKIINKICGDDENAYLTMPIWEMYYNWIIHEYATKLDVCPTGSYREVAKMYGVSDGVILSIRDHKGYYGNVIYKHWLSYPEITSDEMVMMFLNAFPEDAKNWLTEVVPYKEK